jgi:hypothetical protein
MILLKFKQSYFYVILSFEEDKSLFIYVWLIILFMGVIPMLKNACLR